MGDGGGAAGELGGEARTTRRRAAGAARRWLDALRRPRLGRPALPHRTRPCAGRRPPRDAPDRPPSQPGQLGTGADEILGRDLAKPIEVGRHEALAATASSPCGLTNHMGVTHLADRGSQPRHPQFDRRDAVRARLGDVQVRPRTQVHQHPGARAAQLHQRRRQRGGQRDEPAEPDRRPGADVLGDPADRSARRPASSRRTAARAAPSRGPGTAGRRRAGSAGSPPGRSRS